MIEINLIPDVKQELIRAQRTRAAVITGSIFVSIVFGAAVVLLLLYVFLAQGLRHSVLDGQIEDGAKTLAKVEDLSKILTIQNQLEKISELNAQKSMNSRVFDMLDAVSPRGDNAVQFSQVNIDTAESSIRLEGQTRGYDSMEVFKKTLGSAVIEFTDQEEKHTVNLASDISTSEASFGEDASGQRVLRFVLTYKYPEELFSPKVVAPVFRLSIDGNVTDSYLGIPGSLFTERARDIKE